MIVYRGGMETMYVEHEGGDDKFLGKEQLGTGGGHGGGHGLGYGVGQHICHAWFSG